MEPSDSRGVPAACILSLRSFSQSAILCSQELRGHQQTTCFLWNRMKRMSDKRRVSVNKHQTLHSAAHEARLEHKMRAGSQHWQLVKQHPNQVKQLAWLKSLLC
jgi:hypothetical protein